MPLREIEDRQSKLALTREQDHVEAARPSRQFLGTRVIPKWNISPESCILKTRAGEDSLELYQACILPQDQFSLSIMPETKLEEIAAHDFMRVPRFPSYFVCLHFFLVFSHLIVFFALFKAANVAHNLTLRIHHWRVRCQEAKAQAHRLDKEKAAIESKMKAEYDSRLKQMEVKIAELEARPNTPRSPSASPRMK
ncbi:hypothetical protein DH2020_010964 [Rehmannia glutinosa]|uniref:Uncharacterized protein n=1 Tax=Rehmannia glutinosa TaxID=99300 RepID=A0ABR0XC46_REHGL